jgi:hypothetical protein
MLEIQLPPADCSRFQIPNPTSTTPTA